MQNDRTFFLVFFAIVVALPLLISWAVIAWYRHPHASPWPVRLVCWPLVALGAFGCLGLAVQEVTERRVGLGTGVVLFGFLPLFIKGATWLWQHRQPH